jgi:uncharacterized protein (TIGR02145 family)
MKFFTQQGRALLLVCLIVGVSIFGVVYAQQFIRLETCNFCKGTGRFPCQRCLGKGCQECGFSGVVKSPCIGGNMPYTCCICDGDGKRKIDTRFEKCSREFFKTTFGGGDFDVGYECPDGHPIGKVVIVDAYNNGNILKKYSTKAEYEAVEKAEIDAKLAPIRAEEAAKKKAQEDERERIRQEAERTRLEREKIKNSRQPFTDTRDGKKYLTVKIGGKTWMAENLNYKIGKSWCYDNNNSNCDKYGRLYDLKTAMKACPKGWHLPTSQEWDNLATAAGGKDVAGKMLRSASDWNGSNGTDDLGFSALPGGHRPSLRGGEFKDVGEVGYWWVEAIGKNGNAYYTTVVMFCGIGIDNKGVISTSNDTPSDYANSMRCVADN